MEILWTEVYRPKALEDVALMPETRKLLAGFLEAGEIPHLLLHGPPGTGKTTLSKIITDTLDCQVMVLNASKARGIDVIRGQVGTFARAVYGKRWNIVFLDEADRLTPEAQDALRNDMETYANRTRFILTGNYLSKVVDALQSRCMVIELSQIPLKERYDIVAKILTKEGVEFTPQALLLLAERHHDMRKLLGAAQRIAIEYGAVHVIPETAAEGSPKEVLAAIRAENWAELVRISKTPGMDHREALRSLFWEIDGEGQGPVQARLAVAKAVHESGYTPDPVIHFLGTCAELYGSV